MNISIKRVLSLALAVCMIATLFTGCKGDSGDDSDYEYSIVEVIETVSGETGSTDSPANTSSTSSKNPSTATSSTGGQTASNTTTNKETNLSWKEVKALIPASAKGKTIEVVSWNPLNYVKQAPTVVSRFEKETGIKIKWTVTNDCDNIAVAARVAANDSPDIIRCRNGVTPTTIKSLQPLSDINYNFNDKHWDKQTESFYTVNGKVYATSLTNSPFLGYGIVAYNTNLIDNYGLEDPYVLWKKGEWTWDKMHEIARKFLKAAGDGYNGVSQSNLQYADCLGVPSVAFNGKAFVHNIDNQKFLTACKYMAQANAEGLYDAQPLDQDGFNSGKLLFLITQTMSMRTGHNYFRQLRESGAVKCVPLPAVDGQAEYYATSGEYEAYGIAKGAKNADIAPFFLRYYLDEDNYDMSSFYGDDTTKEVITWYQGQKTWADPNIASTFMTADTIGLIHGAFAQQIINTTPAQMQPRLDSYVPKFDAAVDDYNAQLKGIVK